MNAALLQWRCTLCGFEYDEAAGLPAEGFPPGTRWADIPDDWGCPDCGYAKADFEMATVTANFATAAVTAQADLAPVTA